MQSVRAVAGLLRRAQSLTALLGILILAIVISPAASDGSRIFLQSGNLTDILRQVSLIGIISLAMTFVILTGGIELRFSRRSPRQP
jgi:ribose/xylose/arabinose/galactoside ABC-type transport system permease subunit